MIPPNYRCKSSSLCRWCLNATECKEGYVLRKVQRGLIPCRPGVIAGILRSMRIRTRWSAFLTKRAPDYLLTLNGRDIPFVINIKYLGVTFAKRMTWILHIEKIEAKAFRRFIKLYFLLKSERLIANIKLTLHKALMRSVMNYDSPAWDFAAETYLLKLKRLQFLRFFAPLVVSLGEHRSAICFRNSVRLRLNNKII
jgi:hypothetical protein